MQLPALLWSDPHFAASPSTDYRWGVIPWLADQCKAEKVKTLVCLGDVTDAKDNHGAELVNRTVSAFDGLRKAVPRTVILMGNHDYLKRGHMFFDFLRALDGIEVITEPTEDTDLVGPPAYFLPYSRNPAEDWKGLGDFSHYTYLFIHHTVTNARTSNGQLMGERWSPVFNAGKVWAGDIHVPQVIGGVEYVGSPYQVHLGDNFKPRCVLIERDGNTVDLHFSTVRRLSLHVRSLDELKTALRPLKAGDHAKVSLSLDASDRHQWRAIRREASRMLESLEVVSQGVELASASTGRITEARASTYRVASPAEVLRGFVDAEGLPGEAFDAGMDILESL